MFKSRLVVVLSLVIIVIIAALVWSKYSSSYSDEALKDCLESSNEIEKSENNAHPDLKTISVLIEETKQCYELLPKPDSIQYYVMNPTSRKKLRISRTILTQLEDRFDKLKSAEDYKTWNEILNNCTITLKKAEATVKNANPNLKIVKKEIDETVKCIDPLPKPESKQFENWNRVSKNVPNMILDRIDDLKSQLDALMSAEDFKTWDEILNNCTITLKKAKATVNNVNSNLTDISNGVAEIENCIDPLPKPESKQFKSWNRASKNTPEEMLSSVSRLKKILEEEQYWSEYLNDLKDDFLDSLNSLDAINKITNFGPNECSDLKLSIHKSLDRHKRIGDISDKSILSRNLVDNTHERYEAILNKAQSLQTSCLQR
jgi:vacuolar-type H+-ATPase subunit E/Vma4